jgi:hypothetical protein
MSRPAARNIHLPFFVNIWFSPRIPSPQEGRIAIVTDVGGGERWTPRMCSALTRRRTHPQRTAKSCGPDPPTLGSSLQMTSLQATAARQPGAPRRSRISRQTIARGMPDRFGCPVVACVRKMHISLHARPAGAASIRCSPRPLDVEGGRYGIHPGASVPRECERASLSAVMPRLDRGIQYAAAWRFLPRCLWNTGSPGRAGR